MLFYAKNLMFSSIKLCVYVKKILSYLERNFTKISYSDFVILTNIIQLGNKIFYNINELKSHFS